MISEALDLKSMYIDELTDTVTSLGYPKFRAKQLYEWMHKKYAGSVDEMTNLPLDMRVRLKEGAGGGVVFIEEELRLISREDGTEKFLFKLSDGQMIETVLMKYHHGNSVCISSQAGCRMGCDFCASTIGGLIRNLTASEMLEQIYSVMRLTGERVSNIVVMGTGESLDNYDNLIRFIKIISGPNGVNISQRNITVSSCGLVPMIRRLADEGLSITFALSLHAVTDEERRKIMPVAKRFTIAETLDACRYYFEKTGRRVTFEFCVIKGFNDTEETAIRLARLLKGEKCHVNMIPVNPVKEKSYERSTDDALLAFKKQLEKNHINVTIRRSMGRDIDAACGQLRRKYMI